MNLCKLIETLKRVEDSFSPAAEDIEFLLGASAGEEQDMLFHAADTVRKASVGDGIFLRGIVEFSNCCENKCGYCGLNKGNRLLRRYRMTAEEILDSCARIAENRIRTAVLQSGEDRELDAAWLAEIIREIKEKYQLTVTLSVGEKSFSEYKLWREAGAERYLLKIETTDRQLYERLHPGMSFDYRLRCLDELRMLGYEVGSGNIIGLKGQTLLSIAEDLLFFKKMNLDMIGIGPFIAHPQTFCAGEHNGRAEMVLKTIALTRIITKDTNIPATTALASLEQDFRKDGLQAGSNVLMPNFTPLEYRRLYTIYPGKRCLEEPVGACAGCMEAMVKGIGRYIDYSVGGRKVCL